MTTARIETLRALATEGRADPLPRSVRGLAAPGLWVVECGTLESYYAAAVDGDEAMLSGLDHYEIAPEDADNLSWTATQVERIVGDLFDGVGTLEVLPCGDMVRVSLRLPRLTERTAEGLPVITTDSGLYHDLAAIDAAVAEALGLDVGALENPGATFTLDGEMLWTWTVAAKVAS